LSNVDENCKYKRTEKFEVKGVEVEHQAGQKCRGLAWAVELRKQFPKEFEEVEIMTQPSSNCDGVLLAWIVEEQCEEEICSLWIRDCFSAVFQEQVVQRQFTGCQASAQILGKMTQQLQLTDTDFAKSFKASFRKQLEEQRLAAKKGGTEYKIGYKEIILATVGAQRDEPRFEKSSHQKDKALLLALKDDKKAEAVKKAEAAKAAAEPVEDLQLRFKKGEELRVVKEEAGALQYGKEGSFADAQTDGKASIFTDYGVMSCHQQHLQLKDSSWKKAAVWKQFTQLGRLKKQEFLQLSGCLPALGVEAEAVVPQPPKMNLLEGSHIALSWHLLRWQFSGHEFLESCQLVDAECTYKIDKEERWKEEIQKLASNKMHIFVPVLGSPAHWALLVGHRSSPDAAWQFCYRDTLADEHADCKHKAAIAMQALTAASELPEVPARCNSCRQTASESGQLVLSYIEAELAELASEGPASRGWPGVLAQSWDKRLEARYKQLQLEVEKVHAEVAKAKEREKKLEEQQEQRRMKALEMLAKAKDQNSKTAQAAKAAFKQNSQYFTHKDLSPDAREA
ncbi:unnamed protein product, partial [Effrenium voratum]